MEKVSCEKCGRIMFVNGSRKRALKGYFCSRKSCKEV